MKLTSIKTILTAIALPFTAYAAENAERGVPKTDDTAKTPDAAAETQQFNGPITAVNRENKTITINDAKVGAHILHIGEKTKLMRGDKDATWDDLTIGAKVDGVCIGNKESAHAQTITIKE